MDCSVAAGLVQPTNTLVCFVQVADWRIYITPALVFLSAVIAILAMVNTRSVARQRGTLDPIEKTESTEHYRQLSATFSRIRRSDGFATLAVPQTADDGANGQAVMDYLNHYELISIGIRHNILDEAFYRAWMRAPFVRDWNAARDLIQRQRWKRKADQSWEYHRETFENYQFIACRWSSEVEYLSEDSSGPPSPQEAGGPGDEPMPRPKNEGEEATARA